MPKKIKLDRRQMPLFNLKRDKSLDLMKAVALKAPVKKKIEQDFTPEEAEEIRRKLKEKKAGEDDEAKTEEEKERREKAIKVKKIAKEMEKGNQSKIILFPSYSRKGNKLEWYKLGGFSALYYVYRMSDRMGKKAKLMKDTDRFAKMHGVASIRDVDDFLKKAMRLGEFERHEETLDGLYILYLKKSLSDEEVGILRRTEAQRREMMHNVLRPRKADAEVYQAILMIDRQVLPRTAKMEVGYFRSVGHIMAEDILEITRVYFDYANEYISVAEAKKTILRLVNGLRAGVALLGENNVWGYDVATAIGENIEMLGKAVEKMKG